VLIAIHGGAILSVSGSTIGQALVAYACKAPATCEVPAPAATSLHTGLLRMLRNVDIGNRDLVAGLEILVRNKGELRGAVTEDWARGWFTRVVDLNIS
jgi:hypothetical protein